MKDGAPQGLSFDPRRVLSGTPTASTVPKIYELFYKVTDEGGESEESNPRKTLIGEIQFIITRQGHTPPARATE